MKCRKNVKHLTDDEKRWFVEALYEVRNRDSVLHPGSQSRYDDFVEVHREAMSTFPDPAHADSAFFPWHRELLWRFEKELQVTHPQVRIPYWDWTREHAGGDSGFPFTYDFLGPDGDPGDDDRVKRDPGAGSPYPHSFDPEDWDITVKDGSEPDYLQRSFGTRSDAPNLPENDSAVTGTSFSFRDAVADVGYQTHRQRSESIHNLVHRWCNGNMMTASSPNDPVFFLHHAAIDRMWSIWQGRNDPDDPYVNTSGATGHVEDQPMVFGSGTPPWSGSTTPAQVIEGHDMHGDGVWYDTDRPEVSLDSGSSLDFSNVPEGLTAYRAVRFRVRSCRNMRLRITGISGSPYAVTSLGSEFLVSGDFDPDPVEALVWVQFDASLGSTAPGSVQIEAYFIDEEGYYAATEGGEVILDQWTISLTASIVPRVGLSMAMVLDRSGSMAAMAGGGTTRSELMKSAVSVVHALLDPADEVGLVGFDDEAIEVLPFGPASAGLGSALAPGGDLEPRNTTGIGLGVIEGAGMLAGASHDRRAMLVLTDGNENVEPYVDDLPDGTIDATTYAIGFGLPGHVSDDVLNRITQNTGGDLVITGELDSDAEQFQLTKYFLQILAGIQSQDVVLDPDGQLTWGARQVIDVPLTNADAYVDIIVLCPFSAWLDFRLVTPGGKEIKAVDAAALPNAAHVIHPEMQAWRLQLPTLQPDAGESHGGTWKVVLELRRRQDVALSHATHMDDSRLSRLLKGAVPWSCVVHATSNVAFDAGITQTSLEPGAEIAVHARLNEYGVPFTRPARVWAELTDPDGLKGDFRLDPDGDGRFLARFTADRAGLYRLRIRAEGHARAGGRFVREKTLSAGTFAGGDRPRRDSDESGLCRVLHCLLDQAGQSPELVRCLERKGLDIKRLRRCLGGRHAPPRHKPSIKPAGKSVKTSSSAGLARLVAEQPEMKAVEPQKPRSKRALPSRGELFADPDAKAKPRSTSGKRKAGKKKSGKKKAGKKAR